MRSVGPCTPQRTPPHRAAVIYLEKEGGCGPSFHVPAASPPLHLGALAQHCHPPPPLLCHPGHARGCSHWQHLRPLCGEPSRVISRAFQLESSLISDMCCLHQSVEGTFSVERGAYLVNGQSSRARSAPRCRGAP